MIGSIGWSIWLVHVVDPNGSTIWLTWLVKLVASVVGACGWFIWLVQFVCFMWLGQVDSIGRFNQLVSSVGTRGLFCGWFIGSYG